MVYLKKNFSLLYKMDILKIPGKSSRKHSQETIVGYILKLYVKKLSHGPGFTAHSKSGHSRFSKTHLQLETKYLEAKLCLHFPSVKMIYELLN